MVIRTYDKDPRTKDEQDADARVFEQFERGDILKVEPSVEKASIRYLKKRNRERKALVASFGLELRALRAACGVSQDRVAKAIGTQKSNISRIESGRYGGLTIERLIAILEAIRRAAGRNESDPLLPGKEVAFSERSIHDETFDEFHTLVSCLER